MEASQLSLGIVVGLVLVALAFDFMNGFHDAANSIATVVSTRVLKPYQAVLLAALFNFVAVFVFHLSVAATIGKGIIDQGIVDHYVVLGALVGAMLSGGGAAYQGVFRNPLADPYLLGVAAGAGLGATAVIISGGSLALLPVAAFAGGVAAVGITYSLGATGRRIDDIGPRGAAGNASILLAGVAVASMLTAAQTYLQQAHTQTLQSVYAWILGGLSDATWSQAWMILPYVLISGLTLLAYRRLLDVLRVGETEAATLGVNVPRLRLIVVIAATLGVAAAVSVSGLIGFVGIIVPHIVRLTAGASYRIIVPVSMIGGAAFLVLADIAARTVQPDTEVPIGVITAAIGAPFFLFVLRSRRARADLS